MAVLSTFKDTLVTEWWISLKPDGSDVIIKHSGDTYAPVGNAAS
jgi:hypothetical protein